MNTAPPGRVAPPQEPSGDIPHEPGRMGAEGGVASDSPPDLFNVATFLQAAAARQPDDRALLYKEGERYQALSFADLERRANAYAHGLRRRGLQRGHKALLMIRSGPDFVAATFAVFKVGALPVLIDPGMGLRSVLRCVRTLQPDALIAIPAVHAIAALAPRVFRTARLRVSAGRRLGWVPALSDLAEQGAGPFEAAATQADEAAAILFTSGSTGPAKGVVYRHGIFRAQVEALRQLYEFVPGTIDMPGFPLFALFSTALGVTCLIPELDPSRPARCNPALLVDAIREHAVHSMQGSPAIWTRVARYCVEHGLQLPSIRRIITFGAPIPVELIKTWHALCPNGEIYTPYGATEALPVSSIDGRTIVEETAALSAQGAGTCVGTPAPGIEIRLVHISDEPIEHWTPELEVPPGEVGEVVVRGEVVTWAYLDHEVATRASKIHEQGSIWHRMGDLGYLDAQGRLWFCGRKAHRVDCGNKRYLSVNAEGMVDPLEGVGRSALVGVGTPGQQEPVMVVEPAGGKRLSPDEQRTLAKKVLDTLATHALYKDVRRVLFHPNFPVDPRHNAKIHREELALWASRQA